MDSNLALKISSLTWITLEYYTDSPMPVLKVTDDTFEQDILKSETPVLVDFWQSGAPHVTCWTLL